MKLIAITQRIDTIENRHETRDALDQRWISFLHLCGILPVLLPNSIETVSGILKKINIQGFLLTGGNNSPQRDEVENFLIKKAINEKIPLLGVCHGMQMIQTYFNIALQPITQHIASEQTISINGQPSIVNSYHDWGTTETTTELHVFAKASDGIVKAIRHVTHPLLGIMWHPERLSPFQDRDIQLVSHHFQGSTT